MEYKISQIRIETGMKKMKQILHIVTKALSLTQIDCFHGNTCSIFPVAFIVQNNTGRNICMRRRVKRIQVTGMSTELFHCPWTESITSSNHHPVVVFQ